MDPTSCLLATLTGLLTGLSLIVAIGPQNTFVLQQGLRRQHVLVVVAVCTLSDLILILAGVAGVGAVVTRVPLVAVVARWAGATVLLCYALLALRRAVRGGRLDVTTGRTRSAGACVAAALAMTWLNPHVYLDTVLLLGAVAGRQGERLRWWFALGAMVASTAWFAALGVAGRKLAPLLRTVRAWRILDLLIALIMVITAVRLALG